MNYAVLLHKVQRYKYLDGKTLNEVEREALEVVHLYELIQVNAQHLESYHQVLPKNKLVQLSNDILLILWIGFVKVLNQFSLDQALLVESFLVFKDL